MKISNPEQTTILDGAGNPEHAARNPLQDALNSARNDILGRIDSLTSTIADSGKSAKDAGMRGIDVTNRYVRSNPWQVAGIAAALGFVLGAIVTPR